MLAAYPVAGILGALKLFYGRFFDFPDDGAE